MKKRKCNNNWRLIKNRETYKYFHCSQLLIPEMMKELDCLQMFCSSQSFVNSFRIFWVSFFSKCFHLLMLKHRFSSSFRRLSQIFQEISTKSSISHELFCFFYQVMPSFWASFEFCCIEFQEHFFFSNHAPSP